MSLSPATEQTHANVISLPDKERRKTPLSDCVRASLALYFKDLDGHPPQKLHHMVIGQVERPLLQMVMEHANGNQTKAADILGINRSTLRKKLLQYGLE
jgi:Fis family transcriptional regulator